MRLWPFKYEVRQLTGANLYLNDLQTLLGSSQGQPLPTRTGQRQWNSALASSDGPSWPPRRRPKLPGLDPLTMSMLVRQTVLLGNAVIPHRRESSFGRHSATARC